MVHFLALHSTLRSRGNGPVILLEPRPETTYFTNGSKTDTTAGNAVIKDGIVRVQHPLPSWYLVLSIELTAILHAIRLQSKNLYQNAASARTLPAIQSILAKILFTQHPIAQQIVQFSTENALCIILIWTPGHRGISGNELADSAAKEASNLASHCLDPIPKKYYLNIVKQKTFLAWEHHWQSLPTSDKFRAINSTVDYWTHPPKTFTRRLKVKMRRLRFGHTALTHNYLLNKSSQPLCSTCAEPLSVTHFLLVCPRYSNFRRNLLANLAHSCSRSATICNQPTNSSKNLNIQA